MSARPHPTGVTRASSLSDRLWSRELAALAKGRGLKNGARDATIVPKAWGLAGSSHAGDAGPKPITTLTDIRPQIEIALQLEALHGDPIDD